MRPIDRGNGLVAGSVGAAGQLLQLGTAHPRHGFVELSAAPPFDEADRFDPDAVRAYRGLLTDDTLAVLRLDAPTARVHAMTWVVPGERAIHLGWQLRGTGSAMLRFAGRLQPPVLAEITEAGVRDPVPAPTIVRLDGARLIATAAELPATGIVTVASRPAAAAASWRVDGAQPTLHVECDGQVTVEACCELVPVADAMPRAACAAGPRLVVPDQLRAELERLREVAVRYVAECTALRVSDDAVCLLADHRLLPLGWVRDAYYQAQLLLTAGSSPLVAAHLRWLWTRAERRGDRWVRSYLPTGAAKDMRFQADQQLYPLLELADYVRATGSLPHQTARWSELVRDAWNALPVHDGLAWTEENAADDLQPLPYLASVQLLRAHTAARLQQLEISGVIDTGIDFDGAAAESRAALEERFVIDGPAGPMWAYAVDAVGNARSYHDANDLPTALAPLWELLPADDPVWRSTMQFAFSTDNPGYAPGRFGGLGSLHTPGTWPLGDVQEWVWASLSDDWPRAERVLTRLVRAAYPDGMLPEAYDVATCHPTARAWFAWPGAVLGALLTGP